LTADAWQSAAPGPDAIPLEPASEYASLVNLHLLLKFDSEARRFIAQRWKELVIQDRMTRVGCGLLGLVGLLGVVFGYLKVDLATGGTYRGWLRCAAGLAILAIVAASLLGVAA